MSKTILLATFSLWLKGKRTPINGMIEPLLSYFSPKKIHVDMIDGTHPGSSNVFTRFNDHKISLISILLWPLLTIKNSNATQIIFKIRDFLSVFEWALSRQKKYDLFIGLESVYTLSGILLKKLGKINKVVYYVSDYSPNRYTNKTLNDIYLWLDRYCCYNADFVWDVSRAFQPARIQSGLDRSKMKPLIHVPNALFPKQICPLPISKRIPFSLVYAGTLGQWNGPDIAVEAIAGIVKKFPKTTLHIYGTNGKDQKRVQEVIKRLRLEKHVVFHGFIGDVITLSHSINQYMIGLAPYRSISGSHRIYGDATKLRLYMGAGLPIVTTAIPPLGKEIKEFGAGTISPDNPKSLAEEVIKIFSDKTLYSSRVSKATSFARNNTWKNTYDSAFSHMLHDK